MTLEKLQDMLATQLNVDKAKVTKDANIIEDLGADSLEVVELLMDLENELGVSIPDEKAKELKTVGDILKCVESLK